MKKTYLYKYHESLNAQMIDYNGFLLPLSYTGITKEHLATRSGMSVFDVSHMGEIIIEGEQALSLVNKLVTNIILNDTNKVTYTLMCDENGFVIDDLLVYVIREDKVLLVVNASNIEKDITWIAKVSTPYGITPKDTSDAISQIALQGPTTIDFINEIISDDVSDLTFMTYRSIPYQNRHIIVSRTGYTGEDGFEIYGFHEAVFDVFDKAIKKGAIPCGLGARDTLRFEAGLPLYGHEISDSINPLEAGLGFAVKLDKDFIGRDALIKAKENPKRKLVGLELIDKGIPRHGNQVFYENELIGVITTGYLLPGHTKGLAYALVKKEYSKLGTQLLVKIRKNKVLAKVRKRKFYIKNYKKQEN